MKKQKSDFTIIENTRLGRNQFGHNYGSQESIISIKDINALLNGKALAIDINCGEYVLFIELDKTKKYNKRCDDNRQKYCNVEKMGCKGCYYNKQGE